MILEKNLTDHGYFGLSVPLPIIIQGESAKFCKGFHNGIRVQLVYVLITEWENCARGLGQAPNSRLWTKLIPAQTNLDR